MHILIEHFGLAGEMPLLAPRYNIAPTQPVVAVRMGGGPTGEGPELAELRWGLIPHWAKDPAIGARMINARAETVAEKPAYKAAFRRRRCLIPADGFYEWQKDGRRKQPFFITLPDDRLFALAGLWERWEGPDHSYIESCTVLTTEPNELVRPIHNRMPVIVSPEDYGLWLDPTVENAATLAPVLRPYQAEPMQSHPVGPVVNNPRNDSPECLSPAF